MDNFHTIDDDFNVDDNIVLTSKQYDLISDGYYNLRQLHSKLNDVVDPKILEPLTNMLTILGDEVIVPHFKIENKKFLTHQEYLNHIGNKNNFDHSIWSLVDEQPKDFNERCSLIPLKHKRCKVEQVFIKYETYSYSSAAYGLSPITTCIQTEGVTWLDMWKAANKLISSSGDVHHIFIEGFILLPSPDSSLVLELITGS